MFVNGETLVLAEGPDAITIRARMDFGVYSAFMDDLLAISGPKLDITKHVGALNVALMTHNIVGWEGPGFLGPDGKPLPVTPENIRHLDPDNPLVERVLAEVQERNPLFRPSATPKVATNAGG
jgi:hypothetical protein